ncbi:hypothetical protein SETIT_5G285800v2 [Setaria italica]|uniref:Transcription factor IIIC 90kDa subunit N-terminal domain-containing protein n=1 Tax=Setaria italica TaxID=4555 RepID=K3XED1_SETIT|nr:uncharacterized protein LOC101762322 isoform X1 [Setaria italica]XP_004969667.1 uncharacterized protein LOC101762322 isoform X1 [Setaria italica]RCV26940.1 hypothetical protein SETIT_5G285800v2 [Setaria italica]
MSAMAPHYQAATLIASPSYPNAIAWSSDNLVAVASGHIVTILNPAALEGPRGLVGLRRSDPFPIGVVNREDLFEPCLVPTCLARDTEPCARSISWSQQGFAPNYGCLLAVCTVDGRVKLYRSPIWEFCDEWVEVADISQLLFNHYKVINFEEDNGPHLTSPKNTNTEETEVLGSTCELQDPLSRRGPGQRKRKPPRVDGYVYDGNEDLDASKDADFSLKPCSKSKKKSSKKTAKPGHEFVAVNRQGSTVNVKASLPSNGENKSLPLITAKQYARRDAHLSSLVVAWSPLVSSSDGTSCLSRHWCILAVGSKSGNVSFWKLHKPEYYTIDAGVVTSDPILIGVLQAHKSWVSAITWEVSSAGSSKSSLLLATGCSDGSVKIWLANIEGLNQCTNAEEVPFALVAEVTTDLSAPVSSISLAVPIRSQYEVNLAIGRVSGSLETWIWNTHSCKIENTNACHAHDQVVTGLSWGMDGYCLYSCSQDNSARCWIYHENHLEEIPVHTNFPEPKESTDLSEVSNRCFGLTLAPGEQMIAVVRGLDLNLLDQMYQARTQKAVVEFIWIGGQFVGIPLDRRIDVCNPQSAILSSSNLWWGSNILWSLKKYENVEKSIVLWDVVTALQGFKKYAPAFLETLMDIWISALFSDDRQCVSINSPSYSRHDILPSVSLRKLHLLNIICRKVMLSDHAQHGPGAENGNDSATDFWNTLLIRSERELRERLVGFTFAAVLKRTAFLLKGTSTENSWFPVGVAQMDSWVSMNDEVHNQLSYLRSRIKDLENRIDSACEYSVEETCLYCSAPVPFESTDVAICRERHTLTRCKASMLLCSVLQPAWHCVCCGGMVDKLLPESFFTMQASPLDANNDEGSLNLSGAAVPLCPFCGILLQRQMPVFLLSTSPV